MTRLVRNALGRFLASGCASALALLVVASSLAAQQTTGKIEGTVTDPQGVPIASAQVTIVGTSFGALTDDKGYYFFNNVPIGTHTLRAKFIGYTAAELPNVRVLGGFTVTQNFKLTPSAVAIGPVVVEAAANPIVPRDQVTSQSVVHEVYKLPIDDVRGIIAVQPGVVESGATGGLVLRGGRPGEANVYIDGAPVRSAILGSQSILVNTNAVEEASVTTGAIGVQFGDAQSGVITYSTKAGGQKLQGSALYETDEPFGNSISLGFNRFEGSIGGPVPSVKNLTWFVSGVLQGQLSAAAGRGQDTVPTFVLGGLDTTVSVPQADGSLQTVAIPRFVQYSGECPTGSASSALFSAQTRADILNNYGFDCQGRRLPLSWNSLLELQGKLQYSYGTGSSISLTAIANGNQFRAGNVNASNTEADLITPGWPRRNIGDPLLYTGTHQWSRLGVLNWNHAVFKSSERELSLNANISYAQDRQISGPLDPAYEQDTRSPRGGIELKTMRFAGFGSFPFPITDQTIQDIRTNAVCPDATPNTGGSCEVPLLNRTDLRNNQPFRMNPYGFLRGGWFTSGFEATGTLRWENRWRFYGQADWQANRFHRFNIGAEYKKWDLAYWNSNFIRQFQMDAYVVSPWTWSAWVADRLDLGDVVLQLGVRYDRLNAEALFSKVPGRIFTNPAFGLAANYQAALDSVFTPSGTHSTLSPRLGVSFPISDKTNFRLSYAHQVQTPDFNTMLSGSNNDLSFTNSNDQFGRDITFGKTILFEFGVRHAFSPDLVLDVAAYNKDFVSDPAYRIKPFADPASPGSILNLNVLTNADFGYARGVDVKLDKRVSNWLNASVAYTLQVARSTGSDPFSYLNTSSRQVQAVSGERLPPPEQALPTDDNRVHNVVGSFALTVPADWQKGTTLGAILHDIGVFGTFRAVSGLPYTRIRNTGGGNNPTSPSIAPRTGFGLESNSIEPINSSTMPWTKALDIRVNKGFRLGATDWQVFVDARNVFNFRNVARLFVETGDVVNPLNRTNVLSSEFADLRAEAASSGALRPDASIDLTSDCAAWSTGPVNCVVLRRTEARWGNGDGLFTQAEQERAFNAEYNLILGVQNFYAPPISLRLGAELNF